MLEKTLEICKEIQPVHPRGDQSWIFIETTGTEAETPILWLPNANNWLGWKTKPWCFEWLKAGGEEDNRGWYGWMALPTQWTWVWACSRSCWWTGKPRMLQSMWSQTVGHDWATELNWTEWSRCFPYFLQLKSKFWNKRFMIWAIVISQSCLLWLFRAFPSFTEKK